MDNDKIINFPITSAEQYKAYLKAEETTMMKVAGKLGYICGTIFAFISVILLNVRLFIKHFVKHKKRKNFHVVHKYYGGNPSFSRHLINRVRICSLEKKKGRTPTKTSDGDGK